MSKRKAPSPPEQEEVSLEGVLDAASAIPASDESPAPPPGEAVPSMDAPEWTPFVMSKLLEDEVFDGHPTVEGLRRITNVYVGDVVESVSRVAQAPNAQNGHHSCVEHHLTVQGFDGGVRRHSGVADVFEGNGDDPNFSFRYSSATCETRAESRAYRRALKLRHVCAAEEISQVPVDDSGMDGRMTERQVDFIDMMCKRCDINAWKYMNCGKRKFASRDEVPYQVAVNMCGHLSILQAKRETIEAAIRGYDPRWLTPSSD